jgi:hypothetical protein
MSKTNDTSKLVTLDDPLDDTARSRIASWMGLTAATLRKRSARELTFPMSSSN